MTRNYILSLLLLILHSALQLCIVHNSWYSVCLCCELEHVLDSFIELSFTLAFQLEFVSKLCLVDCRYVMDSVPLSMLIDCIYFQIFEDEVI